jgi:hypothetical protein
MYLSSTNHITLLFFSFGTNSPPHPKTKQNMDRDIVGHLEKVEKGGQDSWLQRIYRREELRKRERKEHES